MSRILSLLLLFIPLTLMAGTVVKPVKVYDGDSFKVDIEHWPALIGKSMDIRLKGADAPSYKAECKRERELAQQATNFTLKFLTGATTVELVDVEKDQYFRLLARVQADGKDLSTALINAGLAKPYEGGQIKSWCTAPKPTKYEPGTPA